MLYLFACVYPACLKRSDCVRVFRGIAHDRNNHIQFASDEDYNYVIERAEATLQTSRFAHMYDEDDEAGDEEQ